MEAASYYNSKKNQFRTLSAADWRNTHNFIKSVLIDQTVPHGGTFMDMGCGQGGDIKKVQHYNLRKYIGFDVSKVAIEHAKNRANTLQSRTHSNQHMEFHCFDFRQTPWPIEECVDTISCQFAFQYAFESKEIALGCLKEVSVHLKKGGYFVGSIPIHNKKIYTPVQFTLPNDNRKCIEYSVEFEELCEIANTVGLKCVSWESFQDFYEYAKHTHSDLHSYMKVECPPHKNYVIFQFQKK